jgi:hypothetical protein
MRWAWNAVGKALLIKHKVSGYISYIFPTYILSIHRIDTQRNRVFNEYSRYPLRMGQHYLVSAWNRSTGRYHRVFVSAENLLRDVGDTWQNGSTQGLLDILVARYDSKSSQESNILAILVGDEDCTHEYMDIKSSLAVPNNVTAAALAVLHTLKQETSTTSLRMMTLEIMENELDETMPVENIPEVKTGVTIVDMDLNEKHYTREQFLCL